MGRKYLMSWEGNKERWVKMLDGVRYRVSCEELDALYETKTLHIKEDTYKLANRWWESKLAELTPKPSDEEVRLARYTLPDLQERVMKAQRELAAAEELARAKGVDVVEITSSSLDDGCRVEPTANQPEEVRVKRLDKVIGRLGDDAPPTDRTIGHQVKRFLAGQLLRGKAPMTHQDLVSMLNKMQTCPHLLPHLDIDKIDAKRVADFYAWLRSSEMADKSQAKCFQYFKRFVNYLDGLDLIERKPKNIDDRSFTFNLHAKKVVVPSLEKVKEMLASLSPRLRLYALLALNCGMTEADIGTLALNEYHDGRIVRKRTKTRHEKNVPIVNYPLWKETKELLARYPSSHPELVLTSKTGTKLWRDGIVNGKNKRVDLIALQWKRGKVNPRFAFKVLRKVSSTLLDGTRDYARFSEAFLGHAPTSIKERHYSADSPEKQALFDEAIMWLRSQLFAE